MTDNSKLPKLTTVEVIKLFTKVPQGFAEDFFSLYSKNHVKDDYIINIDKLAKWLDVPKNNLVKTLRESYTINTDYIEIKQQSLTQIKKAGTTISR